MRLLVFITALAFLAACGLRPSDPFNESSYSADSLYVVSGSCYAGGVTAATGPSNVISKFSLTDGSFRGILLDYNTQFAGDSPVSIADYDSDNVLVLVENTSGRRIDLVSKDGSTVTTYLTNSTALSAVMRSITVLSDLSLLVSKSSAVEKFNSAKSRVLSGANPYINAPAAPCATATTLVSSVAVEPTAGKIVLTHAAASPNNKLAVINATGYTVAGDCNSGTAAPTTTALPTQARFHPNGKLLVAYGSTTLTSNFIYSYDFDASTGAISNPIAVFNDGAVVNGPSSMAIDPTTSDVFVANANATFNTIERFTFEDDAFTRASTETFIPYSIYTRCVADMLVTN